MSVAEQGVVLPEGQTGSSFFHKVLTEAVAEFHDVFGGLSWPEQARVFKANYGDALSQFELARLGSTRRVQVARFVAARTQAELRFADEAGATPLTEFMRAPVSTPSLTELRFDAEPGLLVEIPFEGRTYRGREVIELAQLLRARYCVTEAVVSALTWIVERAEAQGGRLDLTGQRFALMGAGAELAPTPLLQRAGATVLWVDLADPSARFVDQPALAGRLLHAPEASNLLRQPREVAASIARFAEDGPVHIGMFAYAAGASQEWRLGASMNAIVRSLAPERIASLSMFVSPTTVSRVYPEDIQDAEVRMRERPGWQRILQVSRGLTVPGQLGQGDVRVARAVVSVQGVSYQAAQYVSKLAAAETYAVYGAALDAREARPLTVSANVAGITRTRSLSHPVFQAAFVGAPAFGVQIFAPETTRALNGLLVLHDVLNPAANGAATRPVASPEARADRLLSQQVHGGVYSMPFALESAIRVAALLGMARKPSVLLR